MKSLLRTAAFALLAGFALPACADEYRLGSLVIGQPYTPETAGKTAAGYLSITNTGTSPDQLVAVRSAYPSTTLHATEVTDGVARMTALGAIDIPPGATVTLAPQGRHVMFMGLDAPLKDGEHIAATLVFAKAGEIAVEFAVQPRRGAGAGMPAGMDMGGHMDHMAPSN